MILQRKGESTVFQTILSCVIFFGTIAIVALLVLNKSKAKKVDNVREAQLVECEPIAKYDGSIKINLTGVAVPYREVTIAAEVSGAITEKQPACKSGNFVENLDPLISIDSVRYENARDRAKGEKEEADERLKRISADLEAAKKLKDLAEEDMKTQIKEWEFRKKLFNEKDEVKAISESEYNQALKAKNAAINAYETQANRVKSLNADASGQQKMIAIKKLQWDEAQLNLDKANVVAPGNGVIISEEVQKGDFVQVGQPLFVFEDTSKIEIKCDLRPDQLQAILRLKKTSSDLNDRFALPELPVEVSYKVSEDGETYEWSGKLDRYEGLGLNETTRTAPCRILVDDPVSKVGNRVLFRGMHVLIEIDLGGSDDLLVLPEKSIRPGEKVWLFENGQLREQAIKVVDRIEDKEGKEYVIARENKKHPLRGKDLITSPIPLATEGMSLRKGELNSDTEEKNDSDDKAEDDKSSSTTSTESGNSSASNKEEV